MRAALMHAREIEELTIEVGIADVAIIESIWRTQVSLFAVLLSRTRALVSEPKTVRHAENVENASRCRGLVYFFEPVFNF